MKWKRAEAIDIQRIWASHNLRSVLFYLKRIVNVTITKDDLANFKTRGALNAFLILQLGVDYLLAETRRMEADVARDSPQAGAHGERIAEFNGEIERANRAIAERDATIKDYRAKLKTVHAANRHDRDTIRRLQRQLTAAAPAPDSDSGDEPGADPDFPRERRKPQRATRRAASSGSDGAPTSCEGDRSGTIQQAGEANSGDDKSF
jgi:hypothetical protein